MATPERLYLDAPKLTRFHATVTDVREFARRDGVQVWQLALDRTAFYPTGGGQPHDLGTLKAISRSGAELSVQVEDVVEDDGGEVWHITAKPLLAGTEIKGLVDAELRLDHTQQHSGQHLLSAVLAGEFAAKTVAFHMGSDYATIDLAVEDTDAQSALSARLGEIEQRVNRHIASDLSLAVRTVSNEEAQALLAAGELSKLPPREGAIRLVEIPGLDLNACGGTHVERLGEIGVVLLREMERVKKGLRLHFVCGLRAAAIAHADWAELHETASLLSSGSRGVSAAVLRLQAEARALAKERQRLREEIAESQAVQLAVEERIERGLRLVCRVFPHRDVEFVKLLAAKLLEAVPQTVAILVSKSDEPATVVLASNVASSLHGQQGCSDMLREVLTPFHLRGGGTATLAQAQVPAELLDTVVGALERRAAAR